MRYALATAAAVTALFSLPAVAVPIPGLVGTGSGLTAGQVDPNYAFAVTSGTVSGTGGFGVVATGWPVGSNWVANTPNSQWLTPTPNLGNWSTYDPTVAGKYTWTLTFDLSKYNASTASFSGQWAADDRGSVTLNGKPLGVSSGYGTLSSFAAPSGSSAFLPGVNSLVFTVDNLANAGYQNPTGLQVRFDATGVNPVPEPETYAMMMAGLGVMGFIARRRRNKIS